MCIPLDGILILIHICDRTIQKKKIVLEMENGGRWRYSTAKWSRPVLCSLSAWAAAWMMRRFPVSAEMREKKKMVVLRSATPGLRMILGLLGWRAVCSRQPVHASPPCKPSASSLRCDRAEDAMGALHGLSIGFVSIGISDDGRK